jgi:hypothetical protein
MMIGWRNIGMSALFALVACKGEGGLDQIHNPPTVSIVSPADESNVYDGQTVEFTAQIAADGNPDYTTMTARWVTGTTNMCESAAANADGTTTCDFAFQQEGDQSVTVTVTDDVGDTGTATITLHVLPNSAPTVSIEVPTDGEAFEPGDLIEFDAIVDDAEDDADALTVSVQSSIDGDLGFTQRAATSGEYTAATSSLTSGEHLIVITATDTSNRSGQDTVRVVVNGRPGAPRVHIDPDPSPSGLELTAIIDVEASDPEGDNLTYNYEWLLDGVSYQNSTNPSIAQGVTVRDDYWEVRVSADDGYGLGAEGTATITIDNSPPRINTAGIIPTSPSTDDDLTADPQGWFDQDSDPPLYRYTWYKNGVLDAAESSAIYPAGKTVRGDQFQVEIRPYDAYELGESVLSPTITIGDAAPTAPGVGVTPLNPQPEDDLTCAITVPSVDLDGDTFTYQYSWYKNGVLTAQTNSIVDDQYTSHGDVWECRVAANDGLSTGPYGSATVTVLDTIAPVAPSIENPSGYRNETSEDLVGDCEALSSLVFTCVDSTHTFTTGGTCASDGTFDQTITLIRGETTDCTATSTDGAGNVSVPSNVATTEVCDPYDVYEDSAGYGDTVAASVDLWPVMPDDNSQTVTILANALTYGDEDWYVIATRDPNAANISAGENLYNFHVMMSQGSNAYGMQVFKGSSVSSGYPTTPECSASSAYTEYNDYWSGYVGSKQCSNLPVELMYTCEDMSDDYYIVVRHTPTVSLSCQPYELTITNGGP